MCHRIRVIAVALPLLLSPRMANAQAVLALPLPVFGYGGSPWGYSGMSFYGAGGPYGLGYGAGRYNFGGKAAAANLALYNPWRYNSAFMPTPYNPTPTTYNPLLYNAAFNPALAPASPAAYAAGDKGKAAKDAQAAAKPAVGDKAIRPAALNLAPAPARIHLTLPAADATVTLEGVKMKQTGMRRLFVTPPLEPDSKYSYEVVVRWRAGEAERSFTRRVSIRAGQDLKLTVPPRAP